MKSMRSERFDITWPDEMKIKVTHMIEGQEGGSSLEIYVPELTYRFTHSVESKPRRDKFANDIGKFIARCLMDEE